jgi:nucleotide-binding universal stress UspA family protein
MTGLWHTADAMTILAPVDFSRTTDAVVAETIALAKALKAKVVLLNVLQPPTITSEYGPLMSNVAEIVAVGERVAAKQLARVQEVLAAEAIESETLQFAGAPVPNILKQAEKLGVDYIVMGSHGHTAFYDLLVGSTTHGVLLKSPCPVLIVPAEKKKEKGRKAR